jgi:hypothetical protein
MGKRITVRKKADAYARWLVPLDPLAKMWVYTGFIAGHRANRLTRAERAVVKAAVAAAHDVSKRPAWRSDAELDLLDAIKALERAKGGRK